MNGPGFLKVEIQPGSETNEEAFHNWYNSEHGPLRLRLPFILNGYRYKAADGQKPEWSAIYDVSDLSMLEKRIYTRLREERSQREKAVMSTFQSLDRKIYSVVSTRGQVSDPAPVQIANSIRVNEADLENFNKWYEEEHIDMLSKVPGWLRTRRFRMVVGGLQGMPPAGQVEMLAIHDFAAENGLGGPEHNAAIDKPWTHKTLGQIVSRERRTWNHHLTFEKLREAPSTVITTDGAAIRFQLEGDSSAPVVVLVNSILTTLHIWDDVARELIRGVNGKSYRVLRYNARGYSQQDPKSNPTRFDLLADDLEYLLQRVNVEKAHVVVGVSMGGVTSINFAIRHPEMLEKFVACDCNTVAGAANNKAWDERIELAKSKGMGELADVTVKRWFIEPNHNSPNAEKALRMVKEASFDGFVQNAGALCNYDLSEQLPKIKTPGLLIAGEGDGKLPEVMQKFGIPNTSFTAIPNAGHLPMLENHEAFMKALAGFL